MGAVPNTMSGDVETKPSEPTEPGATATPEKPRGLSLTYQVILRHLAKFRDAATAVRDLFATHAPTAGDQSGPSMPVAPAVPESAEAEPRSPLELRIESHMAKVDQALRQAASLNPEHKKKGELPPEILDQIRVKERTIHDIVGAELHFWAATIEQNPLAKFDSTEQTWILWIILLANIIGVDAEHKEHLTFLEDWAAAQEHS